MQRRLSRQASKCFLGSDRTGGLGNIYVFTTLQWKYIALVCLNDLWMKPQISHC